MHSLIMADELRQELIRQVAAASSYYTFYFHRIAASNRDL